jgi:hypothetical protein
MFGRKQQLDAIEVKLSLLTHEQCSLAGAVDTFRRQVIEAERRLRERVADLERQGATIVHDEVILPESPTRLFEWGDLVRHLPSRKSGRVIPRPAGYATHGQRGKLIWIQLTGKRGIEAIRGCYAENLRHI